MNEEIRYRPYRSHAWFVPFAFGIGVAAFVMSGYCLMEFRLAFLALLAVGGLCMLFTKILYDSSNITVFFEQEGLRVTGGRCDHYQYVLWENLPYAYYARSYKGHLFLVLSPNALSEKQVKQFVNRGAYQSELSLDGVFVVHMDAIQDVSAVRALIGKKTLFKNSH